MTDFTIAGKQYRRKIAKEFRRRINEIRRAARKLGHRRLRLYIVGDVAFVVGIPAQELRSIVFGTRDPDALTIGSIAHVLGLKMERQFEIAVAAALEDVSMAAS